MLSLELGGTALRRATPLTFAASRKPLPRAFGRGFACVHAAAAAKGSNAKPQPRITVVGLGPGPARLMTRRVVPNRCPFRCGAHAKQRYDVCDGGQRQPTGWQSRHAQVCCEAALAHGWQPRRTAPQARV